MSEWEINLITTTRDEALRISDFLARGFDRSFFADPKNVPVVTVGGGPNYGKSMICEAMSRSLLDGDSVENMIAEGQKFQHYMEFRPSSALFKYCYISGTIDGVPATVSFDRLTRIDYGFDAAFDDFMDFDRDNFDRPPPLRKGALKKYQKTFQEEAAPKLFKEGINQRTRWGSYFNRKGRPVSVKNAFEKPSKISGIIFSSGPDYEFSGVPSWIHFHIDQPLGESGRARPGEDDYFDLMSDPDELRIIFEEEGKTPKDLGLKGTAEELIAQAEANQKAKEAERSKITLEEINQVGHVKWTKYFKITVNAPELKKSPRFRAYWSNLRAYAETGQLIEPDIDGGNPEPVKEP